MAELRSAVTVNDPERIFLYDRQHQMNLGHFFCFVVFFFRHTHAERAIQHISFCATTDLRPISVAVSEAFFCEI